MKVYIVSYKGTIYGVFDTYKKADLWLVYHFGKNWEDIDGTGILTKEVE